MKLKFSGLFMPSINQAVDRVNDENYADAMLRKDPVHVLIDARAHLADHRHIDSGDITAWERLGMLIDCHFSGLTEVCGTCGRMQGEHTKVGEFCPDELFGYFMPKEMKAALNGFPDYHTSRAYRMGQE